MSRTAFYNSDVRTIEVSMGISKDLSRKLLKFVNDKTKVYGNTLVKLVKILKDKYKLSEDVEMDDFIEVILVTDMKLFKKEDKFFSWNFESLNKIQSLLKVADGLWVPEDDEEDDIPLISLFQLIEKISNMTKTWGDVLGAIIHEGLEVRYESRVEISVLIELMLKTNKKLMFEKDGLWKFDFEVMNSLVNKHLEDDESSEETVDSQETPDLNSQSDFPGESASVSQPTWVSNDMSETASVTSTTTSSVKDLQLAHIDVAYRADCQVSDLSKDLAIAKLEENPKRVTKLRMLIRLAEIQGEAETLKLRLKVMELEDAEISNNLDKAIVTNM